VSAAVVAVLLGATADAQATFPGRNGRIAFVRGVYDPSFRDWQRRDVYSVKPDGSGLRNLTRDFSFDQFSPAWSADGRRIAYVEGDGASTLDAYGAELWTMRANGSRKRRLTENGTADLQPAWSPDGKWIVFSRRTTHGNTDLAVIRSSGGRVRLLTRTTKFFEYFPAWSPDGRRIAYKRDSQGPGRGPAGFFVLTLRTGHVRRVAPLSTDDARPEWAPSGRLTIRTSVLSPDGRLRAVARPSGRDGFGRRIEVENVDGSGTHAVTTGVYSGEDYDPAWQPLPRRNEGGASVR
jgi:Tol biopolymer transport system component